VNRKGGGYDIAEEGTFCERRRLKKRGGGNDTASVSSVECVERFGKSEMTNKQVRFSSRRRKRTWVSEGGESLEKRWGNEKKGKHWPKLHWGKDWTSKKG